MFSKCSLQEKNLRVRRQMQTGLPIYVAWGEEKFIAQSGFQSMVSGCVIFVEFYRGNQTPFDIKADKIACIF